MRHKWFTRLLAAAFTASILLQPGSMVLAFEMQDVSISTAETESEESTGDMGIPESKESESPIVENDEALEERGDDFSAGGGQEVLENDMVPGETSDGVGSTVVPEETAIDADKIPVNENANEVENLPTEQEVDESSGVGIPVVYTEDNFDIDGYEDNYWTVANTEELMDALGPHRRIVLKDGLYILSSSLNIYGDSLILEAEHDGMVEILVTSDEQPVINIESAQNIKIEGCILGHTDVWDGLDGCGPLAYVVECSDSTNVIIEKCDLYGCGVEGIHSYSGNGLTVKDCIIRDCMSNAVNSYAQNISITDCIISGNAYIEAYYNYPAFDVSAGTIIENCTIINNYNKQISGRNMPAFDNCVFHDNIWDSQSPKEYGICLNGLTWQIDGDILMLGYPLQFDDGTVIESAQVEPLPYSDSSLPWKKCSYQKVVKAWESDIPEEPEILPIAMQFAPYDAILSSDEGQKSYVLAEGSLPVGLVLTADGRIDGIPRECGIFSFTVQMSDDSDGSIENAKYTLEIVDKTDNYIASGSYENIIWYIDANGKLTVSGTGDYADSSWLDSRSPWYEYREQVISAEINVTGMTNARVMFFDCYNLASVDVSNFDTSTVTDMRGMFQRCSSLTSVDVSNFNTERVTDMGLMFCDCSSLEDLDPSNFNSGQLENMYKMFGGCSSLTSLDISFDASHVKNMGNIVVQCNNLLMIKTPYYVNSNVVLLPHVDNTVWRLSDGTEVIEFPRGLNHSVTLTRHNREQVGEKDIPDGAVEFNGHYYYLFDLNFLKNADEAISYCEGRNGYLATITSDEENKFLFDYIKSQGYGDAYFGFSDRDIEGTWKWLNGEEASYTNWHDGEPNAENPLEDYAMFFSPYTDGTWNDGDFTSITAFICEWETYSRDVTTLSQAVKFTPYESILSGGENQNIVLTSGTLPSGLSLTADGRLSGVPTESGSFSFMVQVFDSTDGSSHEERYALSVNENTDANFNTYADPGYELIELVPNLYFESIPDEGSQLMVSVGSFEEFTALYLDGEKLTEGVDYTAESGSTRITIQNQTLKRKSAGSHTLAMEFRKADTGALKWAAQNYIIAEGADPATGGDNENSGNNNTGGDNSENEDSNTTAVVESTSSTIAYTVQFRDTLSKIAQRFYGSSRSWRRIYTDNAATIRNPNRIYPGQVLIITLDQNNNAAPEAAAKATASNTAFNDSYIVVSGDNLYKIALKVYGQGGRWNEIYQANKNIIANSGRIYAGQVLIIP